MPTDEQVQNLKEKLYFFAVEGDDLDNALGIILGICEGYRITVDGAVQLLSIGHRKGVQVMSEEAQKALRRLL